MKLMPGEDESQEVQIADLIRDAKELARRYRALTGRPLGITGEIAEFEAVQALDLEFAPVRQSGYDAVRRRGDSIERLQIKGRAILTKNPGQRIGRIDLTKEWDAVLLVLLNADLDLEVIFEAKREAVTQALEAPGSKSRNARGALAVSKFKSIGTQVWPPGTPS